MIAPELYENVVVAFAKSWPSRQDTCKSVKRIDSVRALYDNKSRSTWKTYTLFAWFVGCRGDALQPRQCHILINSRPYGYEEQRLPFNLHEYRLAPLSLEQAKEFVCK